MGCSVEVICVTCRKAYLCGHSSYGRMHEWIEAIFPKAEHEGHELVIDTGDFTGTSKNGDLCMELMDGLDEKKPLVVGYRDFETVDLTKGE